MFNSFEDYMNCFYIAFIIGFFVSLIFISITIFKSISNKKNK